MDELEQTAQAELVALDQTGATMPFTLKPSEGFYLFSLLQLVLGTPSLQTASPVLTAFGKQFARTIEERLGRGRPALAEIARRGWNERHDARATECPQPVERDEPPTEKKAPVKPPPGKRR